MWGPDGYGAILLVNCDRDNVDSNAQDNCDQYVRCLQGEWAGAAPVSGYPGSLLSYPTGVPTPGGTLKSNQGEAEFIMVFLRAQLPLHSPLCLWYSLLPGHPAFSSCWREVADSIG